MPYRVELEVEVVSRAQRYAQDKAKSWQQYLTYMEWGVQDFLIDLRGSNEPSRNK
jgi:hypothetical protein